MIIHSISTHITNVFIRKQIISSNMRRIYIYGLELLFSTVISLFICGISSVLLHDFIGYMLFLFAFIPLRLLTGGYHAHSYINCCSCFLTLYICTFIIEKLLPYNCINIFILFVSACTFILVLRYAPVEHPNKKISSTKKLKNRNKSLVLTFIWFVIALAASSNSDIINTYIIRLFSSELAALLLFIAGVIKYKERRKFQ